MTTKFKLIRDPELPSKIGFEKVDEMPIKRGYAGAFHQTDVVVSAVDYDRLLLEFDALLAVHKTAKEYIDVQGKCTGLSGTYPASRISGAKADLQIALCLYRQTMEGQLR
jgi:hypothetical protein